MAKQNKHLEHVEDLILLEGRSGADKAIKVLKDVATSLSGAGGPAVSITTKWDGAPAIVCGTDPVDGKFFVGTKSVFNKQDPKICKTPSDIQRMYGGVLASKLDYCLKFLPQVVTKGVLQGDLLFTNDKATKTINGKSYVTFRPNTITYAAESDSGIGREINQASMGIVFHTQYEGPNLQSMGASFGVPLSAFNKTTSCWATTASFQDVGNVAALNSAEKGVFDSLIRMTEGSAKQTGQLLNQIYTGGKTLQIDTEFKKYFNKFYRDGQNMPPVQTMYVGFIKYLSENYNTAIQKNKTLEAQASKAFKWVEAIDFITAHEHQMKMIIATYQNLIKAKNILVNKMNNVGSLNTFVETSTGYKVTNPEGYVAISGGEAVKLIDRLEFSMLNFTVPKQW